MRLSDVEDDIHIEMDEFEGLITSNENQKAMRNTITRKSSGGSCIGRTCQMILITLVIIGAFFIGRDYDTMSFGGLVTQVEEEAKALETSLRGKNYGNISSVDSSSLDTSSAIEKKAEKNIEDNKFAKPANIPDNGKSNDEENESIEQQVTDKNINEETSDESKVDEKDDIEEAANDSSPIVEIQAEEVKPSEEEEKKETSPPTNASTVSPTNGPTTPPTDPPTNPTNSDAAENETTDNGANVNNSNTLNSADKWGSWKFYDGAADTRPTEDYCANYPHRDIPGKDFPPNAWQTDAVYVNHFINEGINLVQRVQEAILAEYGHEKRDDMTPEELADRRKMFELSILNEETQNCPPLTNAGCTTDKSFDGLVKRLLHALMTNDSFTVVLGGHSAAAGHGNHFKQSYMMQFFRIMEPVFNRLGIKLVARNIAQGGLGTMQTALGSKSLYGEEVDIIVWDSGMTENDAASYDLFARQALLGSKRAPVLYHGNINILKQLNKETGADIFFMGNGNVGLPITMDEKQVLDLPWATRYMVCDKQRGDLCNDRNADTKFRTKCWIDRPDFTPTTKQDKYVGSQVSWHPGFRVHQLTGRLISFVVLDALERALNIWSDNTITGGHPLSDEYWHITEYYDSIQSKARTIDHTDSNGCEILALPSRVCNMPLNGRSEFTPRANPNETSIRSILKPRPDGSLPEYQNTKMLYEGPDVPNPALSIPDDAIDVYAIAGARRNLQSSFHRDIIEPSFNDLSPIHHNLDESNEIVQGNWVLTNDIPVGTCGGEYNDICGRQEGEKCLLSGHMDHRGGIQGTCESGWLVMELKDVTGFVMIKIESWHGLKGSIRQLEDKELDPLLCDDFFFDYAINGEITSLNKAQFTARKTHPQRVVELFPLVDDASLEKQDMEVAIRIRGCENAGKTQKVQFKLTHVYWASDEIAGSTTSAVAEKEAGHIEDNADSNVQIDPATDVKESETDVTEDNNEVPGEAKPTEEEEKQESSSPTTSPTNGPTSPPTTSPTNAPTTSPTNGPTSPPTTSPTTSPTNGPTSPPTTSPTSSPTIPPIEITSSPTIAPTQFPTVSPSTSAPTSPPTMQPTSAPIPSTVDEQETPPVETTPVEINAVETAAAHEPEPVDEAGNEDTEVIVDITNPAVAESNEEEKQGVSLPTSSPTVEATFSGTITLTEIVTEEDEEDTENKVPIDTESNEEEDEQEANGTEAPKKKKKKVHSQV